jgi:hypothetical protein
VPVLDGSYKLPNGQRALPFEMVEVRKETGRDDSQLTLRVFLRTSSRRLLEANTKPVDHFGHNG